MQVTTTTRTARAAARSCVACDAPADYRILELDTQVCWYHAAQTADTRRITTVPVR